MANRNGRKKTMKKAVRRAGGLLGKAGRGLMGRAKRIEQAVNPKPTHKHAASKKKKRRY